VVVVDTAPEACVKIVATSVSAPVSESLAWALIVVGAPRMSQANEIG